MMKLQMKVTFLSLLIFIGAVENLFASEIINIGGGFAYSSLGDGQCKLLLDAKSGLPVFKTDKQQPSRVVVVGTKNACPAEYDGYKAYRLLAGQTNGYIYTGTWDNGRRVHVIRKIGSYFVFNFGPNPKK